MNKSGASEIGQNKWQMKLPQILNFQQLTWTFIFVSVTNRRVEEEGTDFLIAPIDVSSIQTDFSFIERASVGYWFILNLSKSMPPHVCLVISKMRLIMINYKRYIVWVVWVAIYLVRQNPFPLILVILVKNWILPVFSMLVIDRLSPTLHLEPLN